MDALFHQIQALTQDEKLRLVEYLWDSIAAEPANIPVYAWQIEELKKRKALFDANPASGCRWSDVERRIREAHCKGEV